MNANDARPTARHPDGETSDAGNGPAARTEAVLPPTDPEREAKRRDVDDPADVEVDPRELLDGGTDPRSGRGHDHRWQGRVGQRAPSPAPGPGHGADDHWRRDHRRHAQSGGSIHQRCHRWRRHDAQDQGQRASRIVKGGDMAQQTRSRTQRAASTAKRTAAKKALAKRAPAKKAPAKKTVAKKAPAKRHRRGRRPPRRRPPGQRPRPPSAR